MLSVRGRSGRSLLVGCAMVSAVGTFAANLTVPGRTGSSRQAPGAPDLYIRVNQVGFRTAGVKTAIAFSQRPITEPFDVVRGDTSVVATRAVATVPASPTWGEYAYHVQLDFSGLPEAGTFRIRAGSVTSAPFRVEESAYRSLPDVLLGFMRQQRCGFNPFLDAVCHPFDGRTAYGPATDGSYLDARGGWHDAGDSLKYLITASNAVAQMLLAYQLAPAVFGDQANDLGQAAPNGQPDVLDEARWGLEWMLRLHPAPDQLYHQVGDDRDHSGWRLPQNDQSDYGWGKGSYRVVYFATGKPQGLKQYQSEATGIANLAGRYAAAMALAYRTWRNQPAHAVFATRCLQAAVEVYRLGRQREGYQQGNSYGAPYRYTEDTWADDMEWGAAELFSATRDPQYLKDAARYASMIGATSWIGRDTTGHYQFYPFLNLGHHALYRVAGTALRRQLAGYYRQGLESARTVGQSGPYGIGVPFIWCSNNLVVALATQGILYQRMTADPRYASFVSVQVDWLFGRNPWGTSMFTGIPEAGTSPRYPHLILPDLTGRPIRGGLVDGPVAESIFKSLKGVTLSRPDEFEPFQSSRAVYHDDMQDYSSNEPTLDGTASAILLLALLTPPR